MFGYGYNEPGFMTPGDSINKYATFAYQEVDRMGYKYGVTMSLIYLSLGVNNPKLANRHAIESNLAKAQAIAEETRIAPCWVRSMG